MTQSMRERCARAICLADGINPDEMCSGVNVLMSFWGKKRPAWELRLQVADAVLATISESDRDMPDSIQQNAE